MTKAQQRFEDAVRAVLAEGKYPGPAAIGTKLGRPNYRNLSGRECTWRNRVMIAAGWQYQGSDVWLKDRVGSPRYSWRPPTK